MSPVALRTPARATVRWMAVCLAMLVLPGPWGGPATGLAQGEATVGDRIDEARRALETARVTPGTATPDEPVWEHAIDRAREAVDAASGGPREADAQRVLAQVYQETRWWSRAIAAWSAVAESAGELDETERAAWRDASMQVGVARYGAGDLEGALSRFATILDELPDDAEALRWAGRTALELDRPDDAADHWERLVSLRPDDDGARFHLELARERSSYGRDASDAYREGLRAYDVGELEGAADAFERAVSLAPDWTDPLRWRARSLLEGGAGQEAVDAWQALAEQAPGAADLSYFLERARLQARVGRTALLAADEARDAAAAGRREEALASWRAALDAAPDWHEARLGVARAALAAGDGPVAESAWTELLDASEPGDPIREEAREGVATARLFAKLGPDAAADYGAALSAYERGDTERATERLQGVVDTTPDVLEPWVLLGRIAFARADWVTAARAYDRAVELAPDDGDLAYFAEEARRLAGPDALSTDPEERSE